MEWQFGGMYEQCFPKTHTRFINSFIHSFIQSLPLDAYFIRFFASTALMDALWRDLG